MKALYFVKSGGQSVSFYMPDDLKVLVDKQCKDLGISRSRFINLRIAEFLDPAVLLCPICGSGLANLIEVEGGVTLDMRVLKHLAEHDEDEPGRLRNGKSCYITEK